MSLFHLGPDLAPLAAWSIGIQWRNCYAYDCFSFFWFFKKGFNRLLLISPDMKQLLVILFHRWPD